MPVLIQDLTPVELDWNWKKKQFLLMLLNFALNVFHIQDLNDGSFWHQAQRP